MKKKIFETEQAAKHFAAQVGGTVTISFLPDYMSVITIYVVTYGE